MGDDAAGTRRRTRRARLFAGVLAAAVIVAGAVAGGEVAARAHQRSALAALRPSGIPPGVPTRLANLMALSPAQAKAAPGFRLTDQHGRTIPLSAFRGKTVVLEFMDPHCTDICPIVSAEFVDAYHDLGRAAGHVVFAAVNVNAYHARVKDMLAFSTEHQLSTIPSWHFFTGGVPALKAVWRDYNVQVQAPSPNADIVHTSVIYFIGPDGTERYLAGPEVDHTRSGASYLPASQVSGWGRGIALVARTLG